MKRLLILILLCGILIVPAMAMVIQEPIEGKITESPTLILPKETIMPEETIIPTDTILPEQTILPGHLFPKDQPPLPIIPNRELFKKKAIQYSEKTTLLKKITMVVGKGLGLTPVEETVSSTDIDVVVDDQTIAIIPTDSPYNGIDVHEYCLEYQYGTTNWYNCEQELL
jgi:hypothetical protein